MIVRKTLDELRDLLEPSRDQLNWKAPRFEIIDVGLYSVSGSSGGFYKVKCGRTKNNLFIECLCQANQHGQPCYHALKAFDLHTELMFEIKMRAKHGE